MSEWDATLQLCIFDMRRGQHDGHELEKILFFFPTECPLPVQLSLIGLGEGLISFTKIFSPDSPCEKIESERRTHVFFEPEDDIWMTMVVEKKKENGEPVRSCALQGVLKEAHGLFSLFYGSIRTLLAKHPTGDVARRYLYAFFPDYLSDFFVGKKLQLPSIREGLKERGTIQMISLERNTALEVQSVVELLESWFGSGRNGHTIIIFQDLLVSTTLLPGDTSNLFAYARMRLAPGTISNTTSGRGSKKVHSSSLNSSSSAQLGNNFGNPTGAQLPLQEDSSDQGSELVTPRPLEHDKWWRDQDGFLVTDAWGVESKGTNAIVPTVWLQQPEEQMQLCAFQQKMLTVIMLTSANHPGTESEGPYLLRNQILEKASQKLGIIEDKIAKAWGGSNMNHVQGYRYLVVDHDSSIARASPGSKFATVMKDSLVALNKVRAEMDIAKARSERKVSKQPYDLETCVRTKNNAWVVVRIRGGNELYIVLERGSETLLLTSEAVEKFSRRHCNGLFASD